MSQGRKKHSWRWLASGLAAALALTGCGASGQGSHSDERELVFAAVGSQLGAAYKQILQDFGREHGVRVRYFESPVPTTLTKLAAQVPARQVQFDVAMLNDQAGAEAQARRLTEPLNTTKVPHLAALPDYARPSTIDGPLTALSLLGIAYAPRQFAAKGWKPPKTWPDFVDPRFGSCIVPPDPVNAGSGVVALALVNRAVGGDYTAIDATIERLRPSAKTVPAVTGNLAQTIQLMSQGIACMGLGTQGVALEAKAEGAAVDFVVPRGTSAVGLPLVIPRGAKHSDIAHEFINYVLAKQAQQMIVDKALWAPVRTDVTGTTTLAKAIVTPSDFERHDVRPIPPQVFEATAEWGRKFSALFGK